MEAHDQHGFHFLLGHYRLGEAREYFCRGLLKHEEIGCRTPFRLHVYY
jgi:hypothetical protein